MEEDMDMDMDDWTDVNYIFVITLKNGNETKLFGYLYSHIF